MIGLASPLRVKELVALLRSLSLNRRCCSDPFESQPMRKLILLPLLAATLLVSACNTMAGIGRVPVANSGTVTA